MAGKIMEWAVKVPGLDTYTRMTLLVLADYANITNHTAFPSVKTISARGGMSTRQVQRTLEVLKELGLIVDIGAKAKGNREYRLSYGIISTASLSPLNKTLLTIGQDSPATQTHDVSPTVIPPLTVSHINKVLEQGSEQGNKNKETSEVSLSSKNNFPSLKSDKGKKEHEELHIPESLAPVPVTGDSKLVALWKTEISKLGLSDVVNVSQASQLKAFYKAVGYQNAEVLIPLMVREWKTYTSYVSNASGAFNLPKYPWIPFVAKYPAQALDFYNAQLEQWCGAENLKKVLNGEEISAISPQQKMAYKKDHQENLPEEPDSPWDVEKHCAPSCP